MRFYFPSGSFYSFWGNVKYFIDVDIYVAVLCKKKINYLFQVDTVYEYGKFTKNHDYESLNPPVCQYY